MLFFFEVSSTFLFQTLPRKLQIRLSVKHTSLLKFVTESFGNAYMLIHQ